MGRKGVVDIESEDEVDSKNFGGEYSVGDVIWVKIRGGLWWPGQIVGGNNAIEGNKSRNKKGEVRVRVYGSYEYLYVDPAKSSAEFETILKRTNGNYIKIFEEALEQSISSSRSKGQESKPRERKKIRASKQQRKRSETNSSTPRTKQARDEQEEVRKSPRLSSKTESGNSPQSSARRMRVMKSLGLSAPAGSPFSKCKQTK